MTADTDRRFMALALTLAGRGLGRVWPNPAVGCVIVQGSRIVGRGWTQDSGRPHGEAMALAESGANAKGATVYVTLEPCAHQGRAGPCADALVAAGVARVVVAIADPDPRTHQEGIARLRSAGIAVDVGLLAAEAAALNAGFFRRVADGRPHVTLKLALSLDGRIANAAGVSQWVTGPEARRRVHAMRMAHDAVMVGIGTALADDPDLTVRDLGAVRQPVRIVLDSRLRLPTGGKLARSAGTVPVWVCHGEGRAGADALAVHGIRTIACASGWDGRLDLLATLRELGKTGLTRVFCEGGAGLATSLVAAGLADEVAVFSAGRFFGAGGVPAIGDVASATALGAPEYRLLSPEIVGTDMLHRWVLA